MTQQDSVGLQIAWPGVSQPPILAQGERVAHSASPFAASLVNHI